MHAWDLNPAKVTEKSSMEFEKSGGSKPRLNPDDKNSKGKKGGSRDVEFRDSELEIEVNIGTTGNNEVKTIRKNSEINLESNLIIEFKPTRNYHELKTPAVNIKTARKVVEFEPEIKKSEFKTRVGGMRSERRNTIDNFDDPDRREPNKIEFRSPKKVSTKNSENRVGNRSKGTIKVTEDRTKNASIAENMNSSTAATVQQESDTSTKGITKLEDLIVKYNLKNIDWNDL